MTKNMFKSSLLKRGCLGLLMLFGLVVSPIFTIQSDASGFAIDQSGCTIIETGPGGLNGGLIENIGSTGASHCAPIDTSASLDLNEFVVISGGSTLVTSNPPTLNYVGTVAAVNTGFVVNPLTPIFYGNIVPPAGCKDFFGQTNDNPIINQGVIDFDNEAPDGDLRTCFDISTDPFPLGQIHYDMDGWAWNSNLGWVAMKAEDLGSGPVNRGVSIGSQEFNSELKVGAVYRGEGEFFGYWWNDAVGWIKLNCAADNTLNASDVSQCAVNGGADYQVYIDSFDAITNRAVLAGYAWTDSMGYIDFTGVEISIPGLTPTYEARVEYEKIQSGPVYSNGTNGYTIKVSFFDGATNVTDEFADSRMRNAFCLEYEDNRVIDSLSDPIQKVSSVFTGNAPLYTCGNFANDRPNVDNLFMNGFGWDTIANGGLLGAGSNRFSYNVSEKVFVLNAGSEIDSLIPIASNEELSIVGVKMFNEITRLTKVDSAPQINGALLFDPPHDLIITGIQNTGESTCKNVDIELEFDSPVKGSVCGDYFRGALPSGLSASIIGEPNVNALYADRFDTIEAVMSETRAPFENVLISQNDFGSQNLDITLDLADGVSANELNPLKSLMNLEVSSSVSYDLGAVKVRRSGPTIQNESQNIFELNIQGGLADRSFGSSTFSSGAKDTQGINKGLEVKERVYRVLRNILQMENKKSLGKCGLVSFEKFGLKFSSETAFVREGLNELLSNCGRVSKSGERHVVFVGGNEVDGNFVAYSEIKSLVENQFSNEGKAPVIVLYGVDLLIDENILSNSVRDIIGRGGDVTDLGDKISEVPGFVVIESSDKSYGGDIVVSANVTDVVGYFYADGRMMSAPSLGKAVEAVRGDADTVLNRVVLDEKPLFNQFSLLGALYSSNCIGCASNVPPLRADGSVADTRQLSLIEDLNAFRYTPLNFNISSSEVEVPELDAFGVPTGNTITENYVCMVPCGQSTKGYNPLDSQGFRKNGCYDSATAAQISSQITAENACFDLGTYTSGDNSLSLIEESIATQLWQRNEDNGIRQYDVVVEQGLDESSIRSVNVRSLEIPDGMPVFGAISS